MRVADACSVGRCQQQCSLDSYAPNAYVAAVSSITKPLFPAQLRAYESKRDFAADLLESVMQMKAGKVATVHALVPAGKQ
jgi:hypothetical protein